MPSTVTVAPERSGTRTVDRGSAAGVRVAIVGDGVGRDCSPLGVEGSVRADGEVSSWRIGGAAAVCRSVPAIKGLAGLHQRAGIAEHRHRRAGSVGARTVNRGGAAGIGVAIVGDGVSGWGVSDRNGYMVNSSVFILAAVTGRRNCNAKVGRR